MISCMASLPWLSFGASRTDLHEASSVSLLHSIYGSQVSQLTFSDYESETSLPGTQSEFLTGSSAVAQRRLYRPKSSPAATLAAREQQKKQARPGSARPGGSQVYRGRPGSAAPRQRPSSAFGGVGGAHRQRNRPKTALGFSRPRSVVLLDLEEDEDETDTSERPALRDSTPVHLTRVPEYFDFWQGKPLQRRDFGVKVQKRKAWQRPKSDYGSRRYFAKGSGGEDDGRGQRGEGALETLVERDDSVAGSGGGGDRGREGRGELQNGDGADVIANGKDTDLLDKNTGDDQSGHGNDGDNDKMRGRGFGQDKSKHKWGKGDHRLRDNRNGRLKDSNKAAWDDNDTTAEAERDEYFKKCKDTDGLLPVLTVNRGHVPDRTIVSDLIELEDETSVHRQLEELPRVKPKSQGANKENEGRKQKAESVMQTHCLLPPIQTPPNKPQKALAATSWMDGGHSSSQKSTRFELPMDMKTLEGMSPLQYLKTHCVISNCSEFHERSKNLSNSPPLSNRRLAHCSRVFTKLDGNKDSKINRQELLSGLIEVHHHCITHDQASNVLQVVQFPSEMLVDLRLFAALSCLTERMFSLHFLPIARREVIETVDFEALEWKLRECTISTSLTTLFSQL